MPLGLPVIDPNFLSLPNQELSCLPMAAHVVMPIFLRSSLTSRAGCSTSSSAPSPSTPPLPLQRSGPPPPPPAPACPYPRTHLARRRRTTLGPLPPPPLAHPRAACAPLPQPARRHRSQRAAHRHRSRRGAAAGGRLVRPARPRTLQLASCSKNGEPQLLQRNLQHRIQRHRRSSKTSFKSVAEEACPSSISVGLSTLLDLASSPHLRITSSPSLRIRSLKAEASFPFHDEMIVENSDHSLKVRRRFSVLNGSQISIIDFYNERQSFSCTIRRQD